MAVCCGREKRPRLGTTVLSRRPARRLQDFRLVHTGKPSRARARYSAQSDFVSSPEERSMNHSFTVQVTGLDLKQDDYEDALHRAGCDDALIAVVDDVVYLDFDRAAGSFDEAVESAKRDVERAGGRVVSVTAAPE
jgi:hypothetical protein